MPRLLWIVGFVTCLAGCPQSRPIESSSKSTLSEAERPPLRILVMGHHSWALSISRRWQSISEQRLDVQTMTAAEIVSSTSIQADILILESQWLPTIAERGWISPLPKQVIESPIGTFSESTKSGSRQDDWPLVWRQSANYGQRPWGIPLGVPMLVVVDQTDHQSVSLRTRLEQVKNRTPSSFDKGSTDEKQTVSNSYILDRFLMIAASLNPRPDDAGFLFNINSGQARLHESWLQEAATLFGQLYEDHVELANQSPESAWEFVAEKKSEWALAWPSSIGNSSLIIQAPERWVDTGRGLVASSTSKNRQSGPSNRFLIWLDEDAQRQEFASLCTAIQPTPERWSSSSEHVDVNRYRELMKHAFDARFVVRELRFADSLPYRQRLIEALQAIVKDPSSTEAELKSCATDWDQMTTKRGRDIQKKRLARSFELEAYRD